MGASSIFSVLKDVLLLTEEVKRLNANTVKFADKVESIDKRLVRIETLVEFTQGPTITKRLDDK
jgi:tetrahydromethanopterin S-methyltransferase subunit G